MRINILVFVTFIVAPALALTFPRPVDVDSGSAPRNLNDNAALSSRWVDTIEERASKKPALKLQTKTPCESGKYKAIPNISALNCARRMPIAFQKGTTCYLAAQTNLAAMGPTEMGTCFVYST